MQHNVALHIAEIAKQAGSGFKSFSYRAYF